MSTKYPGGIITKNYVAPTPSSASGVWTLEQQEQAQKAGIWPFGGPFNYIEDVFSTYLWDGNATARNIVNGIDLATKGGMVWAKYRNATASNRLYDTARGATKQIFSDLTNAEQTAAQSLTSFNTDGFSLGTGQPNENTATVVGWTFRKQPKFFDVVTWTGNASSRTISHSLGSVPACIIVKNTSAVGDWVVYHRSLSTPQSSYMKLNTTDAVATGNTYIWDNTAPTSTVFSVGASGFTNNTGENYVAYIFAHDAGGFGLTGTDNVISCGSFTGAYDSVSVNLGYEPQWILYKPSGSTGNWLINDTMRGQPTPSNPTTEPSNIANLFPNSSSNEATGNGLFPTSTGFKTGTGSVASTTYIYIAIRRGPMKVPTDATKVFKPVTRTGNGSTASVTGVGFAPDTVLVKDRNGATDHVFIDKLRGIGSMLRTPQTFAEYNNANSLTSFDQNGVSYSYLNYVNGNTVPYNDLFFKRAPSFFDEVCYTGTGSARTVAHNLGVAPEMIIVKMRNLASDWVCYHKDLGNTYTIFPNGNYAKDGPSNVWWNSTNPTSSVFSVATNSTVNASGYTYVAYLFATCAGVSKVGSYTGNGSTQAIACGFAGGARFVLVKRTDSTGDWYVWDTARGMVSGTDPSLLLNSTAAEVNANSIYTTTGGFQIVSTAAGINASGGSYIFLAIA